MENFVLGVLFALPVFGIVLLLFRDILIKHFIKMSIISRIDSPVEMEGPTLPEELEADILTSYRLLLVLQDEFRYLIQHKFLFSDDDIKTLGKKLENIEQALQFTEDMLDSKGLSERYNKIKSDVKKGNIKESYEKSHRDSAL